MEAEIIGNIVDYQSMLIDTESLVMIVITKYEYMNYLP